MKKSVVFGVLAVVGAAAHAQSSATVFGVVDLGLRYTKNGDNSVSSMSSSGLSSSRIGFRGVEDLGQGLKAAFWLESGIKPDTGAQSDATRLWNRRSTVALLGQFGEVRLGRDFSPTFLDYSTYEVFGTVGVGAADRFVTALGTNADTTVRADNLVSYISPSINGFFGQVSVAAGEGAGGKKLASGRVGYATGPLSVSASYGQTTVTPVVSGNDKYKTWTIGGAYDFGPAKLLGYVVQARYADQKNQVVDLGVSAPVGAGVFRAAIVFSNASGRNAQGVSVDPNDARQLAIGYIHNLSARTALYTTAARIQNRGTAAYVVDGNPALPSPNALAKGSSGVEFGLRHSF